jgi:hypothetical protein
MGTWWWAASIFVALVACGLLWRRRDLAEMHSILFGGTLGPGCVIAEAAFLALLALLIVVGHLRGWLGL